MAGIRISAPDTATVGEIIELKTLIQHKMESGYRRGSRGEVIPRNIITKFECLFEDGIIFSADLNQGISANPFLTFHMRAQKGGTLTFRWTDQHGEIWSETRDLTVT